MRLMMTCRSLSASAWMTATVAGRSASNCTGRSRTKPSCWAIVSRTKTSSATGASCSSILRASIFDRSRISLIRMSRCLPLAWMRSKKLRSAGRRLADLFFNRMPAKPMTELSGVRNSWLMLARNWLLVRLASSAAGPAHRLLAALAGGDVARDAKRADDLARLVAQRHLGAQGPGHAAVRPGFSFLFGHLLAVPHQSLLVLECLPRVFNSEKIEVGFPDRLACALESKPLEMRPAVPQKPALRVFEINPVGQVVHERAQQELFVFQFLLGPLPLDELADLAAQRRHQFQHFGT